MSSISILVPSQGTTNELQRWPREQGEPVQQGGIPRLGVVVCRVGIQVEEVLGGVLSDAQVAHGTGGASSRGAHTLLHLPEPCAANPNMLQHLYKTASLGARFGRSYF